MNESSNAARPNAVEAQKKVRTKDTKRIAPPPNSPAEDEDERVHLLEVIKRAITSCRHGLPLPPAGQEELMEDLKKVKQKYHSWKALETTPPTSIQVMKNKLHDLHVAAEEMLIQLRNLDPFTFSAMVDSIDGDTPFFEASLHKGDPPIPGSSTFSEPDLHLNWAAMRLDDDPSLKSGWVGIEKGNLIQHFLTFQYWIERTTRRLASMEIGTRTDMLTAFYGGVWGQLAHASLRLLEKHSDGEVSTTTHAEMLEGLYPWVADLLEGDDFERQAAESVTNYWAFRKAVAAQEKALGFKVMEIGEDEDLFGAAGQEYLQEAATAIAPLETRRFRRPKKG